MADGKKVIQSKKLLKNTEMRERFLQYNQMVTKLAALLTRYLARPGAGCWLGAGGCKMCKISRAIAGPSRSASCAANCPPAPAPATGTSVKIPSTSANHAGAVSHDGS